ncbi:tRNA(Met) cytidine acetyltransferase TmcA, partial [Vibrio ezurae]
MPYLNHAQQLLALQRQAQHRSHRLGVVLKGTVQWQQQVLEQLGELHSFERAFVVGDRSLSYAQTVTFKQARQKLGQESDLIVADLNSTFDANGFTAVTGTLKGGSLLIVLPCTHALSYSQGWIERACEGFLMLDESAPAKALSNLEQISHSHDNSDRFVQQKRAIEAIHRVVTGHRKRPLVITADRGRGKSAALGIAAAQIIQQSNKTVLVTAPSTQAVKTLFEHASKELELSSLKGHTLTSDSGGTLRFIAPDELLREPVACDLLLVDEAAAIPLPLLESIVERFHRTCFATTVHGYEGCGRGFSIKFAAWLNQHRPGWKSVKLTQPIRWNLGDPVEAWLFDTFLLDAEIEPLVSCDYANAQLSLVAITDSDDCILSLRKAFGLLVNAHYQTTPNDVFQLLDDNNVRLYQVLLEGRVAGVMLGYIEGGLNDLQLQDIQLGKRRPPGHLVPISMVSQLGDNQPALQLSLRVMRIAVHPQLQSKGLGSWMLSQLSSRLDLLQTDTPAYLSTSFGVTKELFNFWHRNDFDAVRLGSKQDQASGCFSVTMVKPLNSALAWSPEAQSQLVMNLVDTASDIHLNLPSETLVDLLSNALESRADLNERHRQLLTNYAQGGASFEATRVIVQGALLGKMTSNRIRSSDRHALLIITDLVIKKLSWEALCKKYGFTGRKQAETQYRDAIAQAL